MNSSMISLTNQTSMSDYSDEVYDVTDLTLFDNLEKSNSQSIHDYDEEKNNLRNHHDNSQQTKIVADIPVGIADLPQLPFKYYDYNEQIKQCVKKLKTLPIGEILTIVGNSDAVGTGKSLFVSVLVRKSEVRSVYNGGIFYINPSDITNEVEYVSILRKLVEDLISYSVKTAALSNIQAQKWFPLIRPSYGDVRMEDCLQSLREITSILNFSEHSSSYSSDRSWGGQPRKVLIVLNDLRTDYLPRLLRACGVTFLVTTRYPDLFSDGLSKGTFFNLEFCPAEHRLHFLELQNDPSIFSSTSTAISYLNEIFETCSTWGEVDLIARYIYPRFHDTALLSEVRARRKMDLVSGSVSTRWVTDHVNDNWKSISLTQHIGSFSTFLMLYESLCSTHKQSYLAFSLLPTGVVFPLQFIMMIWGIKIQQECLDILNILCKKGLISSVTAEGVKLYTLTALQSHLLILLVLREKQISTDDCSLLTTFLMCSIFTGTPTPSSNELSTIQVYLNGVMGTIIKYLTDKKKFTSIPTYRLTKYVAYWRRLYTCFHAGILPTFRGPLNYFQEVIETSNTTRESVPLFDYIYAATYMIENLGLESEIKLKNWLMKGIDILNYIETSQHMTSNHSTSTINIFNHFKIAELRNKLGALLRVEGKFKEALDLHISALSTFQSSRHPSGSPYHNEIAKTFLYISDVYIAEEAFDDAINVIHSVIQFQQGISKSNGHRHGTVSIAEIWMSLGDLYCFQNKFSDTIHCYENAIGIYQQCVGNQHPDTVFAQGLMGVVLLKWSQYLTNIEDNFPITPITESIDQESVTTNEISLTSSMETSYEKLSSQSKSQSKSKHEEGLQLTSNAIAWFLRHGYTIMSPKLTKLINLLPAEEKILFQNFDEMPKISNKNEISSTTTFSPLSSASQTIGYCGL